MTLLIKNKKVQVGKISLSIVPLLEGLTDEGHTMHGQVYHTYVITDDDFQCAVLARSQEEAERIALGIQHWREAEDRL